MGLLKHRSCPVVGLHPEHRPCVLPLWLRLILWSSQGYCRIWGRLWQAGLLLVCWVPWAPGWEDSHRTCSHWSLLSMNSCCIADGRKRGRWRRGTWGNKCDGWRSGLWTNRERGIRRCVVVFVCTWGEGQLKWHFQGHSGHPLWRSNDCNCSFFNLLKQQIGTSAYCSQVSKFDCW